MKDSNCCRLHDFAVLLEVVLVKLEICFVLLELEGLTQVLTVVLKAQNLIG